MPDVPFLVNQTITEIITISNGDKFFNIELSFDVSKVEELPLYYAQEPDFAFSFRYNSIISPCNSSAQLTKFPFQFSSEFEVAVTSEQIGKTYVQRFQLHVLDIRLNLSFLDPVTKMPEFQVDFSLKPFQRVEAGQQEIPQTFYCNYCNANHPSEWNSKEHIIPESLKNKSYVLKNTCKRINHYMSFSYETKVLNLDIIKEILMIMYPPPKAVFRGEVENSLGKKLTRFIQPSGKMTLVENPTYQHADSLPLNFTGANGEKYKYNLVLPFSFKSGMTGGAQMINADKTAERERLKIESYLKQVSEDPSINPDFDKFLQTIGATFNYQGSRVEIKATAPTDEVVYPEIVQTFNSDNEILFSLFLKIAWTYAVKTIGLENLQNPIANSIIYFLKSAHFLDLDLAQRAPEFFKTSTIIGVDYTFWKYGLDETVSKIESLDNQDLKQCLHDAYNYRRAKFDFVSDLIAYKAIQNLDDAFRAQQQNLKVHSLEIKNLEVDGNQIAVCHLKLFGGFFDAIVQLSDTIILDNYPVAHVIKFE